jgi:hypothetical protein
MESGVISAPLFADVKMSLATLFVRIAIHDFPHAWPSLFQYVEPLPPSLPVRIVGNTYVRPM